MRCAIVTERPLGGAPQLVSGCREVPTVSESKQLGRCAIAAERLMGGAPHLVRGCREIPHHRRTATSTGSCAIVIMKSYKEVCHSRRKATERCATVR